MKLYQWMKKMILMLLLLSISFAISLFMESSLGMEILIPAFFTLTIFLVSLLLEGYFYGIFASLLCVLMLNFAFTFPYFEFNFSIPENIVSALILLIITITTSALTTKVRMQSKIEAETQKEKMRADLLRAVSHDLRTPLTTIVGSSSTIVDNYNGLNKDQLLSLVAGIQEDAQWLVTMVENLLTITRMDNENVKITKQSFVLEELIDLVLVKMKKRYPNQKIEVILPEEFIIIPMDVMLIEQVLYNLLENAILHAKGMTHLMLRVSCSGDKVLFEIIDDGIGLTKDQLKNAFKGSFETSRLPVDSHKKNMGIGLSVCAAIIKAHNGQISVENNKEGGCCFKFILDREDEQDEVSIEDSND